jgi:hypothetical protein
MLRPLIFLPMLKYKFGVSWYSGREGRGERGVETVQVEHLEHIYMCCYSYQVSSSIIFQP